MRPPGAPPGGVREVLLTAGSRLARLSRERARRLSLATADRRLRAGVLLLVGIPALFEYLYWFLVYPLTSAPRATDLGVYLAAAADMAAGRDPYRHFQSVSPAVDPTLTPFYIYPPVLAWCLQPLVALPPRVQEAAGLVLLHGCVALFLWACCRALQVTDWQRVAVLAILTLTFFPLWKNLVLEQVNPLLLALEGLWLWAWAAAGRAGSVAGGAALGAGMAFKLIQSPIALLVLGRRRWGMLAGIAGAALLLTAMAVPGLLPEYASRVLPRVGGGTGQLLNQAPAALATRLLHPQGFYRALALAGPELGIAAVAAAAIVIPVTTWVLRRPAAGRRARLVEAGVVMAAAPLFLTLVWDSHLVLLLPALFVLLDEAWRRRSRAVVGLALLCWLMLGPALGFFLVAVGSAVDSGRLGSVVDSGRIVPGLDLWLRVQAEAGAVGMVLLWAGLLHARGRAGEPAPAGQRAAAVPV